MKTLLVSAVTLAGALSLHAQVGDPHALAARVQQRYNGIKDIQGDFVQSYEGGVLRTRTTERGTVAIRRPGKSASSTPSLKRRNSSRTAIGSTRTWSPTSR